MFADANHHRDETRVQTICNYTRHFTLRRTSDTTRNNCDVFTISRVRTKTVKKAAKLIIEKYYPRLTLDFHTNKRICEEIAIIPSKSLRNKIAGFVTHLMKRLRHSQVRGISIKLQEEERERRDNYVPEVSALEHDIIEVDPETKEMLKMLEFNNITGLQLTQPVPQFSRRS
ncbi:40S ribosomal protein S17 isoform X1 [Mycetomoellerius zeteki]|uniref:40S ribosomal protein S17 isoform X1 n=1 Tax=Mycetomoellerius zeteki TaxID=64791 RepID=UPI00084E858B|nr:PREDICTED: 40S ribosomal protein S17 isoform X1 [Trachymyrmex zeteki]